LQPARLATFSNQAARHLVPTPVQDLGLADGDARYLADAFPPGEADVLFAELREQIDWRQEEIMMFGQHRLVPRLVAWHGDAGADYRYSGVLHRPEPWTPALQRIRATVERLAGRRFNSVLLNLYRNGRDGMGWHADDEPELGPDPVIASVSLGAARRFCMRHKKQKRETVTIDLEPGSLLLMQGTTQHHWRHALPKTARPVGERINLTFRQVSPPGD
jgi:alkylated DNA repair dioxygenase AlkB